MVMEDGDEDEEGRKEVIVGIEWGGGGWLVVGWSRAADGRDWWVVGW